MQSTGRKKNVAVTSDGDEDFLQKERSFLRLGALRRIGEYV